MNSQALALSPRNAAPQPFDPGPARGYADYELGMVTRGIDLAALWRIVARHRWLMAAVFAACLLAGAASVWFAAPVYSSFATIQIDQQAPQIVGTETIPDPGRTDSDRLLQTQVDLIASATTARNVAAHLKLGGDRAFLDDTGLAGVPPGRAREALVAAALQEGLSVSSPRDTRLIAIGFDSHDPALAARIANGFADRFIADSLQRRLDTYAYSRRFLQQQLGATKTRLEASEKALVDYARAAGLVDAGNAAGMPGGDGERRSITAASLVDLNAAYSQAQAQRMQAQQRWQQAQATPAMNLPEVLANPAIQNLTRQRAEQEATLQQERQRRQDSHPAVIQARAQIDELDRQIGVIAAGIRASIGNEYRVAAGQEAALRGNVAALKSATFSEQGKGVRYNILKREADTNRTLYNTLLQRFHEVSTQAANMTNAITVIDPAQVPAYPSYPRPLFNMALAGLAGLVLALAAALVRARFDDSIHGPNDLERDLDVPLLGIVPVARDDAHLAQALADPRSALTEAHHAICLALDPAAPPSQHLAVLLTSSSAGEGKSTIALKMAHNYAASGKSVLLIDADMRRGALHKTLGLGIGIGLANLLSNRRSVPLMDAVQPYPPGGFAVLARGRSSANPAELLASTRFAEILAEAGSRFDAVIIDGPPVLGLADAPRLAGMVDATVFVVEANRTPKEAVRSALRRLGDFGADRIGVVLSKYDPARDRGAYGYGYLYDYGPAQGEPIEDGEADDVVAEPEAPRPLTA